MPTSAIEQAADAVPPAVERRAAGERDEAARAAVQLLERERALAFRRAQLHARDQPAEIPVALGGFARGREQAQAMRRPSCLRHPSASIVSSAPMIGAMPAGARAL